MARLNPNLLTLKKLFQVTADTTGVLANDPVLGSTGQGVYNITVLAAAAADSTITVNDGSVDVLSAMAIPVKAAAVTYPDLDESADPMWQVRYIGNGPTLPINIADGTNGEIVLLVEFLGRG